MIDKIVYWIADNLPKWLGLSLASLLGGVIGGVIVCVPILLFRWLGH